ncbi:PREDICTED: zinc finger CCCH domain-containing protein 43-like [Tarenaya hassleriana]|uniref:zinc finger CCCH domain-containing protein 43-like n=1 Tax=Tarenaya hassleriana TaxID=28532 RepID=UPI0008FD3684|nr:PREDICTED: zinc finger CCCH domain-containing protein 43-like [Tarenaya hassleriana]
MDQIEEPTVQNPHNSVSESPLQASSSNSAADPPSGGPGHTAEDVNQFYDQWLTQLQNLELEGKATEIESWNGDSAAEYGRREANGKSEEESDGEYRIESEKLVDDEEIDGKNARSRFSFPVRPEAVDCAFYMKTGNCKYGANCRFNHPVRTKNQVNEDAGQKPGQIECKVGASMEKIVGICTTRQNFMWLQPLTLTSWACLSDL